MQGGLRAKLGYLLLKPIFKSIKKKMDYNENGGAVLLGLKKLSLNRTAVPRQNLFALQYCRQSKWRKAALWKKSRKQSLKEFDKSLIERNNRL